MKIIYIIQTKLSVKNREGKETLLSTDTQDFAYDSLEEANKALKELKQYHLSNSEYNPLLGDSNGLFLVSQDTGQKFTLRFELKELMLKES